MSWIRNNQITVFWIVVVVVAFLAVGYARRKNR